MYLILGIAVAWLTAVVLVLILLRSAARADRAAEEHRRERKAARHAPDVRRVALLLAAVPLAGAAAGAPDAIAQDCANARTVPGGGSGLQATLCVINAERRARNLPALTVHPRLARAARRHAADMVARGYFSHTAPDGSTFVARLRHVGYFAHCASWTAGETLAWGSGTQATPASRVTAWMNSPPHRTILLGRAYREIGVGIAAGVPDDPGNGFTYTAEFGRRRF